MRIKLTPELEAYCAEHKIRVTDGMELDDAQLEKAREMWSRQHPDKDAAEIEIHAIGLVAAQIKPDIGRVDEPFRAPVATVRDWKEIAWKIAVLILLLLITIRGHAQIDVIKVQDNAGAAVGTIAAPFTFKAGANCTWAKSASTYTFNCAGGAAGAGGSNTQVQWNSTGSLAGISSLTTDGTVNTALAGADWLFADLTTPTKKFQFDASNISAVTTRTMNVPDANATFAQAIAAVSHKFITQMSAQGLFTLGQPACADISDAGVFCAGTAYSSLTGIPSTFAPSGHNILSSAHSDTTAASAVRGDGFFAIGATPTWQRLAHPATSGGYFKWNGTDIVASTLAASGTGTPTACTNQFVTGFTLNADAAPTSTCTTDTLASAQHANQGTTTTVLHGNAAGNPAFGAVTTSDLSSTTGNGTAIATGTGSYTSGNCVKIDANGNLVDNGSACGGAGSGFAVIGSSSNDGINVGVSAFGYFPPQGMGANVGSTEAFRAWTVPKGGTIGNLWVHIVGTQGACNQTITIEKSTAGGAFAALGSISVVFNNIAAGTNPGSSSGDTTHTGTVIAGDILAMKSVNGACAAADIQSWSFTLQ